MSKYPCPGSIVEPLECPPLPRLLVSGGSRRQDPRGDLACRFTSDANEPFDGVILADAAAAAGAITLLQQHRAWLAPVADLSGGSAWYADVRSADASQLSFHRAVDELVGIIETLRRLPRQCRRRDDDETLLLARVHSRGGRLHPVYDGAVPAALRYPTAGLLEDPAGIAERLCFAGWFERSFSIACTSVRIVPRRA
ncbi:MAG: hypothetical protein HC834_09170 [Rhodospirillales bacterium]|nr:hypothetical protein [Rhodospirillales bacterium]